MKRAFHAVVLASPVVMLFVLPAAAWHWFDYPLPEALAWEPSHAGVGLVPTLFEKKARKLRNWKSNREYEKACWVRLKEFDFSDLYFGCPDSEHGRWYLHFSPGGELELAGPSRDRHYLPDNVHEDPVDLSSIFAEPCRYERTSSREMTIINRDGERKFSISPGVRGTNPDYCCNAITFVEVGNPALQFRIMQGRDDDYELAFASFRKQKPGR